MTREEFLAAELLRLDDEVERLRADNALLRDLLRGTNLVMVGMDAGQRLVDAIDYGTEVH